jgi:ring-1,2-phenylacetyl-CoA epoxidase subunit PaaD
VAPGDRIPLLPAEEHARRRRRAESPVPALWQLLDAVTDPEIPVISIWELGILQDVELCDGEVVVTITPTYSGCPAMDEIERVIRSRVEGAGYARCRVKTRLAPAWSTSWIDSAAREKLREYGIAPPDEAAAASIRCPHCGSAQVHRVSEFGSTACKALYQCDDCREPFDYFKSF